MEWLKDPDPVTDQVAHSHNHNDFSKSDDLTDNQICDGGSTVSPEKVALFQ